MPLRKNNTRVFYRCLYAGQLQTITLLKRNDDQAEGTVTPHVIFNCRRSSIQKHGEAILADMPTDYNTQWHIPVFELNAVGITYLNALDRIVDEKGRVWQPESGQIINIKLFENWLTIDCIRLK